MTDAAITCSGLTRCFGNRMAVDRIDLVVPTGAILGLLGRNGAGKTTLLRLMLGLLRPTNGRVDVLGLPAETTDATHRGRIGFLAEDHPVHTWMTVGGLAHQSSMIPVSAWTRRRAAICSMPSWRRSGVPAAR